MGEGNTMRPPRIQHSSSFEEQVVYEFGTAEDGSRLEPPSRACDACRKMKIKCVDKDKPPCKRCRQMKIQCRFAVPPVPRAVFEESEANKGRLENLESHVSSIYEKLEDIGKALARFAPPAPGSSEPSRETHPDQAGPSSAGPVVGMPWSEQRENPNMKISSNLPGRSSVGSDPGSESVSRAPISRSQSSNMPAGPSNNMPYPLSRNNSAPTPGDRQQDYEYDQYDPLESSILSAPFQELTRQEEERCLIEGNHNPSTVLRKTRGSGGYQGSAATEDSSERSAKRRRLGEKNSPAVGIANETSYGQDETEDTWASLPINEKGDNHRYFVDPVTAGHCSEEEGIKLYDEFFQYSHPFQPVFDPVVDTWERLRKRSPFCITVIMMIALHSRECADPPSELSKICKRHADDMAKATLFEPIATLETLQGLILMTSWGKHAWRLSCHTMALAVDMRLYRCLPYLHKIRTDSQNPSHMLERQRPLVVGARLWLAIVTATYEQSFNHALPIQFPSPHNACRTQYMREMLDHPFSNILDSRLVVSVELHEAREFAFRPYESLATSNQEEIDRLLRQTNGAIDRICKYWHEYYSRLNIATNDFLLLELENQRAYSVMYTNAPAWFGVHSKADVELLSVERKSWITAATQSGAYLVSSVANKRLEDDSEFGNHNFHVGIIATARYLIRMVEILPEACDLYHVSLDIDRLILKLPYYPVQPFALSLRKTLAKAREQGILPSSALTAEVVASGPGGKRARSSRKRIPGTTSGKDRQPSTPYSAPSLADSDQNTPQGIGVPASAEAATLEFPGLNPFPWNDPVIPNDVAGDAAATSMFGSNLPGPFDSGAIGMSSIVNDSGVTLSQGPAAGGLAVPPPEHVPWPELDFSLADWFPAEDSLNAMPTDVTALDDPLSNWYPSCPQVWE